MPTPLDKGGKSKATFREEITHERQSVNNNLADALVAWSSVEAALNNLFSLLLTGEPRNRNTSLVFYAIENFRSKQRVIHVLASELLKDPLLAKWNILNGHLSKRVTKRNKIAHHDVLEAQFKPPGKRVSLIQPANNPLTFKDLSHGKTKGLHAHDLKEACLEFHKLSGDIDNLARQIELSSKPLR